MEIAECHKYLGRTTYVTETKGEEVTIHFTIGVELRWQVLR